LQRPEGLHSPSVNPRAAYIGAVAAALALGVGAALGFALDRRDRPPSALVAVSHWQEHDLGVTRDVVSGSLASAPARGFVLFHETGGPPAFFTVPGQLRLEVLGRRLDPGALPALDPVGVAVPVVYGRRTKAVVLVGYDATSDEFVRYGFLQGFSLPNAQDRLRALHRLLLGPDGDLYRVDAARRRLDRVGESGTHPQPTFAVPPRCSDWGRYRACANSISIDGRTLLRQAPLHGLDRRWTFVAPSPDARTLLLEQDTYSCGTDSQAYFLPTSGGDLRPAVPSVDAMSEPIGWLRSGAALVALQSGGGCDGEPVSGIYSVQPATGDTRLVLSATAVDATVWGPLAAR